MYNLEISKSKFDLDFSGFKGTTKGEYEILNDTFLSVKENETGYVIKFRLIQAAKKIQPLNIIAILKNNKISGQLTLDIKDEENNDVGKIKFKNLKFVKIKDLIDFNNQTELNEGGNPFINVEIEHDGAVYETKSGKEEEI